MARLSAHPALMKKFVQADDKKGGWPGRAHPIYPQLTAINAKHHVAQTIRKAGRPRTDNPEVARLSLLLLAFLL